MRHFQICRIASNVTSGIPANHRIDVAGHPDAGWLPAAGDTARETRSEMIARDVELVDVCMRRSGHLAITCQREGVAEEDRISAEVPYARILVPAGLARVDRKIGIQAPYRQQEIGSFAPMSS